MTKARIGNVESLGLAVALAISAAVAFMAYRSVDAAEDTLSWVERSGLAVQRTEEMTAAYSRAVSARRAFAVAGDASQLASIPEMDARLAEAVGRLRGAVADDARQLGSIEALRRLIDERLARLDAAVADRQRGGSGGETAEGLALTARIREAREQMEADESRLLEARDARTRRDVARTKFVVVGGTLASFALLLTAFGWLRVEIRRRGASEGFLDSIIENLPNMIFVKEGKELRFERLNRAGEKLLGLARGDLLGKNDFDFFPREQAEAFQGRDRDTLSGRVVVDIPEEPIETKSGERWLHTKKVPILDDVGAPRYLLGISEDITEQRQAARALRDAKDAAEAANAELESFSYSVAHDLRAPLRAIDGFSLALEEDCAEALSGEGKEYLARVRTSAQHMGQLIDGLLGLSRVSRGAFERDTLDLSHLARQSADRLRAAHPERHVELVVPDGLVAEGDSRLMEAALDNLIGNAWKFTGKSDAPRIEVGRETRDGRTVFYVRDNGAGFDQAYAGKLFGAFQRLHSVDEFEGTGIGLATVQRVVRRHGGTIWAEGAVGRGATFYFTL